ncbi:MAG: hypothetical protein IPP07_13510 [Holophagales bacterium]|nr:hypothetical protein [Holophagales bacterium]MBK9965856.1 hypothetical protein [Holophagales bacterium]
MKKLIAISALGLLICSAAVVAGPISRQKSKTPKGINEHSPSAAVVLDYLDPASAAFYSWTGNMYLSNLFIPAGGSYPLDVTDLEVFATSLDGSEVTGAAGVLDGVAVFDAAGTTILNRKLAVNMTVATWTTIPLVAPLPSIASGNFYAGGWNNSVTGTPNDGLQQGSANAAWTGAGEPLNCITFTGAAAGDAGAAGAWAPNGCGAAYSTVSAVAIRAHINTNTPVELMRFEIQ